MSTFRFKHFEISNECSAMKVGTDSVLLGASAEIRDCDSCVLDIGTGTGVVALMIAQRLASRQGPGEKGTGSASGQTAADGSAFPATAGSGTAAFSVTGIDIDDLSAQEAAANFAASPWADSLDAKHCALQDYAPDAAFDLIVSNPPYFDDSLPNPDSRKCAARHSASLPHPLLAAFAAEHLSPGGRLAVIIPEDVRTTFCRTLRGFGLYPSRVLKVRSTVRKPFARAVVEAVKSRPDVVVEEELTIHEGDGWSPEYLALTKDFYLFA